MQKQENNEKPLAITGVDDDNQFKTPHNMTVARFIQEANDLYHWAWEDKEALQASGLDQELVEDLPARIDALTQAETLWHTQWLDRQQCSEKWNARFLQGYELKNRLKKEFRFAFRNHQYLLAPLKTVSRNKNHAAMIQDLYNLGVLGRANIPLLEAIGSDISLIAQAMQTSEELSPLLAETIAAREKLADKKKERDLAYTHLKDAVDEIRRIGQFVFRDDKERRRAYASETLRQKKIHQTRKTKPKPEPTQKEQ